VSKTHLLTGRQGETRAIEFLKNNGYRIIARNFKCSLGEIDIIAQDKEVLCFIEVKTRASDKFGLPQEAVSCFKQRQISKVALAYLKQNNLLDKKARFDVVSLMHSQLTPEPKLIKNAFELDSHFA
jgi:putative endonuclease